MQVLPDDHNRNTVLNTLAGDRARLGHQLFQYLAGPRDFVFLGGAYAGIGKTTITLQMLAELGIPFIYLADTHMLAAESHENHPTIPYLRGKQVLCEDEVGLDLLGRYGDNHWYCDHQCGRRPQCTYFRTLELIAAPGTSWIGVHKHISTIFQENIRDFPGIVVIDEDVLRALHDVVKIDADWLIEAMQHVQDEETQNFLRRLLNDLAGAEVYRDEVHLRADLAALDEVRLEGETRHFDGVIADLFGTLNPAGHGNLFRVLKRLRQFIADFPNARQFHYVKSGRHVFETYSHIPLTGRCIVLDATLEPEILRQLFPLGTQFHAVDIGGHFGPQVTIYQLRGRRNVNREGREFLTHTYPMKSLTRWNPRLRRWDPKHGFWTLINLVNQICVRFQRPLIVCRKGHGVLDLVRCHCTCRNADICHYQSLRGQNDFQMCDAVILFGTPFLPDGVISRQSAILGVDPAILRRALIAGEMTQAIHRLRIFIRDDPITVVVLSALEIFPEGTPVTFTTEDELMRAFGGWTEKENHIRQMILYLLDQIEGEEGLRMNDIIEYIPGNHATVRRVLYRMMEDGAVLVEVQNVGVRRRATRVLSLSAAAKRELHRPRVRVRHINNPRLFEIFRDLTPQGDPPDIPPDILQEWLNDL